MRVKEAGQEDKQRKTTPVDELNLKWFSTKNERIQVEFSRQTEPNLTVWMELNFFHTSYLEMGQVFAFAFRPNPTLERDE